MTEKNVGHHDEARFVDNLKRLREGQGWSQNELARRMRESGWTSFRQTTVSRLEKGEQSVRIGEARALAQVLGVSLEVMLTPSEEAAVLEDLSRDVERAREVYADIVGAVSEYEGQRVALQHRVTEVSGRFAGEDAPSESRTLIGMAEGMIARTAEDAFREGMKWAGGANG